MKHEITRDDIMTIEAYGAERRARTAAIADIKKDRRMEVGPFVTCYFENFDTMWFQVHEMLYIEKGGEDQIPDELGAYNPLIPKGNELVITMMIEIGDADRRARELARLGGIEETISITVGEETIRGVAETDVDRTNAAGKASSVQFIHFPFTPAQIAAFRDPDTHAALSIGHENYGHIAVIPKNTRTALSGDFD